MASGTLLAVACAAVGAPLTDIAFGSALAMTLLGAVAGIAEAALWSYCAEKGRFPVLAATRTASTFVFTACLVLAARGALSLPIAIGAESGVVVLAFLTFVLPPAIHASPIPVRGKTLVGFWLIKVVSYLNRFVESWWAVAALSGVALASFRIGLAPKTLLLMGFTALLQPTLFRVSHDSWKDERDRNQLEARSSAEALVFFAAFGAAVLCFAFLLYGEALAPYADALVVAWIALAVFTGPGGFGMMASALLTNYGAIRVPLKMTWIGLGARSAVYALLLGTGRLSLAALALVGEIVTAGIQNSFWPAVLRTGVWKLKRREAFRVLGRSCLCLGALAFLLADPSRTTGVLVLGVSQLVVAADAATEMRKALQSLRRMPRAESTRSKSSSE
ncbi:MAG: hypothetical protein KatS3mg015_0435 [Fimbriimonadales bacterium]|nr:MAG: hypothetical protein KatS3mg015_0435 [Fimbriimonadales bacterium]